MITTIKMKQTSPVRKDETNFHHIPVEIEMHKLHVFWYFNLHSGMRTSLQFYNQFNEKVEVIKSQILR